MRKNRFLLLIVCLFTFFISLTTVNAEEKKVYWSINRFPSSYYTHAKHAHFRQKTLKKNFQPFRSKMLK